MKHRRTGQVLLLTQHRLSLGALRLAPRSTTIHPSRPRQESRTTALERYHARGDIQSLDPGSRLDIANVYQYTACRQLSGLATWY
jgi:hypothetical protein